MPRGTYSDKEKEQVFSMYAAGIAGREISRQLDIPEPTIRKWIRKEKAAYDAYLKSGTREDAPKAVDLDAMRMQKKIEFINSAWTLIGKSLRLADNRVTRALEQEEALDAMIEEIGAEDMSDQQKRVLIAKLRELQIQGVRELSTLIGTMYDKAALASGENTAKVGVTGGLTDDDRRLMENVLRRTGDAPGD